MDGANYIYILATGPGGASTTGGGTQARPRFNLQKDGSQIALTSGNIIHEASGSDWLSAGWTSTISYYGTQGNTDSATYKVGVNCTSSASSTTAYFNYERGGAGSSTATITIMEFAV